MEDDIPHRVDLSDKALFADHPGAHAAIQRGFDVSEAVKTAFRTIRSANMTPGFGFDQDDALRVWAEKLSEHDPVDIISTADEWIESPDRDFPTLAEFEIVVAAHRRSRLQRPTNERPVGAACPECGDTPENRESDGRVFLTDPTQGGIATSRPCSLCRADQYGLWKAGHYKPRETPSKCHCNHPLCPDAKRRDR